MAIAYVSDSGWTTVTSDTALTIPSGSTGDRMFLLAFWKQYNTAPTAGITSTYGWTAIQTTFADGTVSSGNGAGSMRIMAWYKDYVTGNPTLSPTVGVIGAATILNFSKDASESWSTPQFATAAASLGTGAGTTVASTTPALSPGDLVIGFYGMRDDTTTFNRSTTLGINATGITWSNDYQEAPATHFSTTTGNDASGDAGYRLVASGTNSNLRMDGSIDAAETGSAMWIIQSVTVAQDRTPRSVQIPQLLAH